MTESTAAPQPPPGVNDLSKTVTTAYDAALEVIASVEPRIAAATRAELADQRASLKLIASENYASPAVLLTMSSFLSDKYAEARSATASTPAARTSTRSRRSRPSTRASCSARPT